MEGSPASQLTLGVGQRLVHVRGQHAVVKEVVVVLALLGAHADLLQPLDHAAAHVAGDDDAQWVAVVRGQQPAVLLVGQDHVGGTVQGLGQGDGGAVGAVRALGQLARLACSQEGVGSQGGGGWVGEEEGREGESHRSRWRPWGLQPA